MSGGYYDYVHHKDAAQYAGREVDLTQLEHIACDLEAAGRPELADATRHYATKMQELAEHLDALDEAMEPFKSVWKALDWWKSGDASRDAFEATADAVMGDA